jgi:membrane associated rhomboid family serine protease
MIASILIIIVLVFIQFSGFVGPNCIDKSFGQYLTRSFLHQDLNHLSTNIFSLWNLLELEKEFKTSKFIMIVLFLLFASAGIHFIMDKVTGNKNCAIGFSGVLYGMIVFQIMLNGLDIYRAGELLLLILLPSLTRSNISVSGHLSGAIAGLLAGILFNKI